jgi:hypothetical protein
MIAIGSSVGEGGINAEPDVRIVQQALIDAGQDPKGVDGLYGRNTRDAIMAFQAGFLKKPDGLISPGGPTIRRLAQVAKGVEAPPPPPPSGGKPAIFDWSGDSSQWSQEKKLASMEASMRPKVERIVAKLQAAGFQPKIFFAWRSVAVQKELKKKGHTTVSFSFHNAQTPAGRPNAWAADVIDARFGWKEPDCMPFFRALGAAAKEEGLVWGGDWKTFKDWAHIQGRQNSELAAVKRESGL